jgi:DME family drug/metabolite transporter
MAFPKFDHKTHAGGCLLLVMASILWGTTGTAQALAPPGAQPFAVGAVRVLLGSVVLMVLAWCRGSFRNAKSWPKGWALAAAAGVCAYQLFFFSSVEKTGVAVGTVVTLGTSTVAAGLLTLWADRKPLGSRWILATFLAVGGLILLAAWPTAKPFQFLGVSLAAGAGCSYAGLTFANKRLLAHLKPDAAMAAVFCFAALLFLPFLPFLDFKWIEEPRGMAVAAHLGFITLGLAYFLYSRGLTQVTVATAVTVSLAEPATASLLGFTVLGERLPLASDIGLLLVFLGLLLVAFQTPPLEER